MFNKLLRSKKKKTSKICIGFSCFSLLGN